MSPGFLYLDSFALTEIGSDASLAIAEKRFIAAQEFTLVIGVMNLMEIHAWPKRWSEAATFITSVPFCLLPSPDKISAYEVRQYPNAISLPVTFRSSDHPFTERQLREAIEINLQDRIAGFEGQYRKQYRDILATIIAKRDTFRPENGGKYSDFQRWLFLHTNVLSMLHPEHRTFLEQELARSHQIDITCFRSVYLQALVIFYEYYIQRKVGKPSDIGDLFQLAVIPYMQLAVLDNERHDVICRINRDNLFPAELSTWTLAEFRRVILNQ